MSTRKRLAPQITIRCAPGALVLPHDDAVPQRGARWPALGRTRQAMGPRAHPCPRPQRQPVRSVHHPLLSRWEVSRGWMWGRLDPGAWPRGRRVGRGSRAVLCETRLTWPRLSQVFNTKTGRLSYNLNVGLSTSLPCTAIRWRPPTAKSKTKNVLLSVSAWRFQLLPASGTRPAWASCRVRARSAPGDGSWRAPQTRTARCSTGTSLRASACTPPWRRTTSCSASTSARTASCSPPPARTRSCASTTRPPRRAPPSSAAGAPSTPAPSPPAAASSPRGVCPLSRHSCCARQPRVLDPGPQQPRLLPQVQPRRPKHHRERRMGQHGSGKGADPGTGAAGGSPHYASLSRLRRAPPPHTLALHPPTPPDLGPSRGALCAAHLRAAHLRRRRGRPGRARSHRELAPGQPA